MGIFTRIIKGLFKAIVEPVFVPRYRGMIGESRVTGILQRLPVDGYIVINDIIIKNRSGTLQIDHLVISAFGIFVIETKCYKGWIFGSEKSEKWTQALYRKVFRIPLEKNKRCFCLDGGGD